MTHPLRRWPAGLIALAALAGCATDPAPAASPATVPLAASTQRAYDVMPAASRQLVRAAPVPFLLLPPPWASVAIATRGDRWSALSARRDGVTVSLHGTDAVHQRLDPDELRRAAPPRERVRGVAARVLVNDGIRSVQWREGAVDWALEVECADPEHDARCTGDAFLLELAALLEPGPAPSTAEGPAPSTAGGAR